MEIFKNCISRELGETLVHNVDQDMITRLMDGSMGHEMILKKDSTNDLNFSRQFELVFGVQLDSQCPKKVQRRQVLASINMNVR